MSRYRYCMLLLLSSSADQLMISLLRVSMVLKHVYWRAVLPNSKARGVG